MLSDRFFEHLVNDLKPVRRRSFRRDTLILLAVCGAELSLFFALGAMRPDMQAAIELPAFWWKLCTLAMIALVGACVSISSFDPVKSPRTGLRWLFGIFAFSLTIGWVIDALHSGWTSLAIRLDWQDGLMCVAKMGLLSLPVLIGLGILMRQGAPTDASGTAWASGIAAAAWGAFIFVFTCPYDDPLYIAVWYSAGCGLVTVLARFLLTTFTRW